MPLVTKVTLFFFTCYRNSLTTPFIIHLDTIHRIFVASILVASKYLHGTCWGASQTVMIQEEEIIRAEEEVPVWLNNARMASICNRFYSLQQINQLELSFLNLIKFECFVNPIEVQEYLVKHRQDLLL